MIHDHIKEGETYPACNRCQHISTDKNAPDCPYCHAGWTHDVTRPAALTSSAPAATPAPADAGGACTCAWKAGHDRRCPAHDAYVVAMEATPAPADAAGAGLLEWPEWLPGDKAVVAAVSEAAEGHEGVYLSSKAATRLLRLIAALNTTARATPAPATAAPGAAGEASGTASADCPDKARIFDLIDNIEEAHKQAQQSDPTQANWLMSDAIEFRLPEIQNLVVKLADRAAGVAAVAASAAAPAAPEAGPGGAFGVQLLPAENGPGATLYGEYLYVLLPSGKVTQAVYCDFFTDEQEGEAWGHYTDIDVTDPLPVQPTHYFTPPARP